MNKNFCIIAYLIFIFSSFVFAKNTLAVDLLDQSHTTWVNLILPVPPYAKGGQVFTPTQNNISKLRIINAGNATTTEFAICKGDPGLTGYDDMMINAMTCNWPNNSRVYYNPAQDGTNSYYDGYYIAREFIFYPPVGLTPGDNYYFIFDFASTTAQAFYPLYNTSQGGMVLDNPLPTNSSLLFQEYYSTTYVPTSWLLEAIYPLTGTITGSTTLSTSYQVPPGNTGRIIYNVLFPNNDVHLYEGGLATSTGFSKIHEVLLDGTYQWTATLYNYDTNTIMASTTNQIFKVKKLSDLNFDMPFGLNEDTICAGIASTTSYTNLHIIGDLECGLKKVGIWMLSPSESSITQLNDAYEDLKTRFPFNAYFGLTTAVKDAVDTTATTSMSNTIGIPMISKQGAIWVMPLISSSTLPNAIGSSNADLIRNSIKYFTWLIVAVIIFWQFKKI